MQWTFLMPPPHGTSLTSALLWGTLPTTRALIWGALTQTDEDQSGQGVRRGHRAPQGRLPLGSGVAAAGPTAHRACLIFPGVLQGPHSLLFYAVCCGGIFLAGSLLTGGAVTGPLDPLWLAVICAAVTVRSPSLTEAGGHLSSLLLLYPCASARPSRPGVRKGTSEKRVALGPLRALLAFLVIGVPPAASRRLVCPHPATRLPFLLSPLLHRALLSGLRVGAVTSASLQTAT